MHARFPRFHQPFLSWLRSPHEIRPLFGGTTPFFSAERTWLRRTASTVVPYLLFLVLSSSRPLCSFSWQCLGAYICPWCETSPLIGHQKDHHWVPSPVLSSSFRCVIWRTCRTRVDRRQCIPGFDKGKKHIPVLYSQYVFDFVFAAVVVCKRSREIREA